MARHGRAVRNPCTVYDLQLTYESRENWPSNLGVAEMQPTDLRRCGGGILLAGGTEANACFLGRGMKPAMRAIGGIGIRLLAKEWIAAPRAPEGPTVETCSKESDDPATAKPQGKAVGHIAARKTDDQHDNQDGRQEGKDDTPKE